MVSVHIIGGEGRGYSGIETGIEPYCTAIVAPLIYDRGLIKCCWTGRNRIRSAEAPLVPSAGFDRSVTTNLSTLSASKASHAISSIWRGKEEGLEEEGESPLSFELGYDPLRDSSLRVHFRRGGSRRRRLNRRRDCGERGRGRKRAVKEWKEIRAIEIQPSSRFPGTCTSGNSPTAKWICDKVTLERTRNSDKETSFPSVPLSLSSSLGRTSVERFQRERKTEGGGRTTEVGGGRRERRRGWKSRGLGRRKETRADNVRVMVAPGYFYILGRPVES